MQNKEMITSGQLFVMLFVCKISSVLLISRLSYAGFSVWSIFYPLLIFSIISFVFLIPVFSYKKQTLQGKNIPIGIERTISAVYLLYFIYISVYHAVNYFRFVEEMSYGQINVFIPVIFLFAAVFYASVKGIEASARFSGLVFITILLSGAMIFMLLIPSFSAGKLPSDGRFTAASFSSGIILNLSETEEIAALFILCRHAKGKFLKCGVIWNTMLYIFLMLMLILISGVSGKYLIDMSYPFYRVIDGSEVLQRFNPLFLSLTTGALFCSLSVDLYIIRKLIEGTVTDCEKTKKIYPLISAVILLMFIYIISDRQIIEVIFSRSAGAVISPVFAFVIPLFITTAIYIGKKTNVRKLRKAAAAIIAGIIIIPIMNGCSAAQLNQRLIVQGIGIDKTENRYKLTMIVLDADSQNSENAVSIEYTEGANIEQGISALENREGKKLLLSQCLFIMLNRDAADNMGENMEYFKENKEIMKTANIMVSDSSGETITSAVKEMGYTSEQINLLSDSSAVRQSSSHFSLFDYRSVRNDGQSDMLIPYIEKNNELHCLTAERSYLINAEKSKGEIIENYLKRRQKTLTPK